MVSFAEMFGEELPQIQSPPPPASVSVGQELQRDQSCNEPLTDEEREDAIRAAGEAMCHSYAEWDHYGCFDDHATARQHERLMKRLILGRSPTMVARLERERGLV